MTKNRPALRRRQAAKVRGEIVDYRALADFRFAIRRFRAFSETAAAAAGLSPQQHQALLTIQGVSGDTGVPIGVLAARLLVRQHTAVELVNRLERSGLARRKTDPHDKRRALVVLTRKGAQRLRSLSAAHLAELKSIAPALAAILRQVRSRRPRSDHRATDR